MGILFDLAGFGGALALTIITALVVCYGLTLRWIAKGYQEKG